MMRRIGLIGGTTWHSTADYYRLLNVSVNERLGGKEYAELSLDSINFGDLVRNNEADDQPANEVLVVAAANRLAASGADGIAICANTPHIFAEAIERETGLPLIHIAAATSAAVKAAGIVRIGLLGTKILVASKIYERSLADHGIECLTPSESDKDFVHETIFNELAKGEFTDELRSAYLSVIDRLKAAGAEGVILGCTEIPILFAGYNIPIPSFDTTRIHVGAIVDFILS